MLRALLAGTYVGAAVSAALITPLVVRLAHLCGVIDLPNSRKIHQYPMPRLGGLAIAGAMGMTAIIALLVSQSAIDNRIIVMGAASLCILIVGVFDDVLSLPSKFKLLALVAASAAVCAVGVRIDGIIVHEQVWLGFGWMTWPITILWISGITVSINFIDGLDGLAAGISAIACAIICVVSAWSGQIAIALLSLALLGSLTGFLIFNFNPAKVFMGDCGSMLIGFLLGCLSILQTPAVGTIPGLMLPLLALSVPVLDMLLTLIRRGVIHRGSVFAAERGHIHHRLLDLGLCQRHAVLVLYAASLASAGVGLMALLDHGWPIFAGLSLIIPLLIGLFQTAGSTRVRETIGAIRRNRAIGRETKGYATAFEDRQLQFRQVKDFDGWWKLVSIAAEKFDFTRVELPLVRRDGSRHVLVWKREDGRFDDCEVIAASIPIRQRRKIGLLRAHVEVASGTFLETAGQRVALFSRLMADHSLQTLPDMDMRVRARGPAGEKQSSSAAGNRAEIRNFDATPESTQSGFHHHAGLEAIKCGHVADAMALLNLMEPVSDEIPPAQVGLSASLATIDLPPYGVKPKSELSAQRIAIVHDFLYCYAGAERVLEQIIEVFPQADLFSLFDFLPADQRGFIQDKPVITSFIHRMPFARRKHRAYLPLMPLAIEQLDVSQYDIVISSSYLAAKGVLTRPDQLHVSYCHTPVRFAWDLQHQYLSANGLAAGIKSLLPRLVFHYIRSWDARSSNGVDVFVTNSDYVGRRIEKVYRRRSTTIYPPVNTDRFTPGDAREDFYLTASRMVPYKRVDLIVEAFNRMPARRLIVVGDGPEYDKIKSKCGPNVRLVGHQPFEKLRQYMRLARAFLFAAEEDFGIVPVEAQACGTPVIAYGRGGVTESVVSGVTGLFFQEQTAEAIVAAVEQFENERWDSGTIRQNAMRFSVAHFREQFRGLVESEWAEFVERRVEFEAAGALRHAALIASADSDRRHSNHQESSGVLANGD